MPLKPEQEAAQRPLNGRDERIKIPLPFEDAVRALLKTPPPSEKPKPNGK